MTIKGDKCCEVIAEVDQDKDVSVSRGKVTAVSIRPDLRGRSCESVVAG